MSAQTINGRLFAVLCPRLSGGHTGLPLRFARLVFAEKKKAKKLGFNPSGLRPPPLKTGEEFYCMDTACRVPSMIGAICPRLSGGHTGPSKQSLRFLPGSTPAQDRQYNNAIIRQDKKRQQPCGCCLFCRSICYNYFLTLSTIALKAAGLFNARSARTLRLISIPALCKAPIN